MINKIVLGRNGSRQRSVEIGLQVVTTLAQQDHRYSASTQQDHVRVQVATLAFLHSISFDSLVVDTCCVEEVA
jgi:hypothetical protein